MEVDYYSKYLKYKSKYLELKAQLGGEGECDTLKKILCDDIFSCKGGSISGECFQFISKSTCDTPGCNHHESEHKYTKQTRERTYCVTQNCNCKSFIQSLICVECNTPLNNHNKYQLYITCSKGHWY